MLEHHYTPEELALTRQAWHLLDAYHDMTYFVRECRQAYKDLGIGDVWARYFAGRASPLGRVGAGTVVATFYNFSLAMVEAAVPAVWDRAEPPVVLASRFLGMDAALRRLIPGHLDNRAMEELAETATRAARSGRPEGKALYAANLDVPDPASPHLALFHAATLVREHKGDAHNALLMTHGISGCQAHVLMAAIGHMSREQIQSFRGWTDDEWTAEEDDLKGRGVLDPNGEITPVGRALRFEIELRTEAMAAEIWRDSGFDAARRVTELISPILSDILASGELPTAGLVHDELEGTF